MKKVQRTLFLLATYAAPACVIRAKHDMKHDK